MIRLPGVLASPLWGQVLVAITSAGAFAAFMSTFSGLLVSMSGALAHDIYGKILFPQSSDRARLTAFKVAAVLIGAVSMGLGFLVESFDIAMMVGWAFAIAACSYFPLLLLGAWWPRLTVAGAAGGMLLGGVSSLVAIVTSMLLDKHVLTFEVLSSGSFPPRTARPLGRPAVRRDDGRGVPADSQAHPRRHPPQDAPPPRPRGAGPLEELHRALMRLRPVG